MTKPDPEKAKRPPPAAAQETSATDVEAYLIDHPDFLVDRDELLARLSAPTRFGGNQVVDFQQAMVDSLRRRLENQERGHQELIATSRANLSVQARVHAAVLAILGARTFEHLIETIGTDLAIHLDVDAVALCVEGDKSEMPKTIGTAVHVLPTGTVDRLLGPGRNVLLKKRLEGDPSMFGPAAQLVRSAAFLRLQVSPATPPGLLCMGSRLEGKFRAGQGTELMTFLARVIETAVSGWLDLPRR